MKFFFFNTKNKQKKGNYNCSVKIQDVYFLQKAEKDMTKFSVQVNDTLKLFIPLMFYLVFCLHTSSVNLPIFRH